MVNNITISGLPGAGSSTLGKALAKKLGFEYFSGGNFMRQYAIKKGVFDKNCPVHHKATVYEDEYDRKIDYEMRDWLENKKGRVFDSWLSGFMAQGIKGVLKILVFCDKDDIRVDRVVNRDRISIKEAKKHIFEREKANLKKWTRMYEKEWNKWVGDKLEEPIKDGVFDFYNPKVYDLAIDTYSNHRQKALKIVLKELKA